MSAPLMKKMKLIFALLIGTYSYNCLSQNYYQIRVIDSLSYSSKIDSLKILFGYNKKIPAESDLPILLALSYYPELDSSCIVFKKSKIKTTLNTRPAIYSILFLPREKRKYVIRINSNVKDSIITLNEVPFNAEIGLFGHELNHIIDYRSKGFFGIIYRLISYTSNESKEKFEKEIDKGTIYRGLGWQLYDWSYFVLNSSDAKKKYKEFKKMIYLEPDEIHEIIMKSSHFRY
jgi:hypothetical protein